MSAPDLSFTASRAATCRKCRSIYEASDAQTLKRDFICKPCRYLVDRERREKRKALGLPVSGRRKSRDKERQWEREYYKRPEVRARRYETLRRRMENPVEREKSETRMATRLAIRRGDLIKMPCEVCGSQTVDAHHDDYSKPLQVRWLCRAHHAEFHARLRARGEEVGNG